MQLVSGTKYYISDKYIKASSSHGNTYDTKRSRLNTEKDSSGS